MCWDEQHRQIWPFPSDIYSLEVSVFSVTIVTYVTEKNPGMPASKDSTECKNFLSLSLSHHVVANMVHKVHSLSKINRVYLKQWLHQDSLDWLWLVQVSVMCPFLHINCGQRDEVFWLAPNWSHVHF